MGRSRATKKELLEQIESLEKEIASLRRDEEEGGGDGLPDEADYLAPLFDTVNDAIYVHGLSGQFLHVNDSACRMLGYSREELLKMSPKDIDDREYARLVPERQKKLLEEGQLFLETAHVTSDGSKVPIELNSTLLETGGETLVVSVARDIRGRKEAEKDLREAKAMLSMILDGIAEAIVFCDKQMRIQWLNKAAEDLADLEASHIRGQHCYSFWHQRDRACEECPLERAFASGRPEQAEIEYRDGSRWLMIGYPVYDERGGIAGGVEIGRDISQDYMMDRERARLSKLETIGTLAGGIAHDFNNMLAGVMGNISLAKFNISKDQPVAEQLDAAEKASLRAKELTQQLMNFVRGGESQAEPVQVAAHLENSVSFALRGSSVKAELDIPGPLTRVEAAWDQIDQVIGNIVLNACQAMPEGGVLRVGAADVHLEEEEIQDLGAGDYVMISIADSGHGIAPKDMEKIFEPCFSTRPGASGLGLTTARSIVRHHNGGITVDSEPGEGARFRIYLPAAGGKDKEVKHVKASKKRGTMKILLMDDEEIVSDVCRKMLEVLGHEVQTAENGEQALELYAAAREEGKPFDLVILDLTVQGGMGGKQTMENLLEMDPEVTAIVSSGYSSDPIMSEYRDYGFSGVVPKPFRLENIQEALEQL